MSIDVMKLTNGGNELLKDFVDKMGLNGAIIATSEGLEMASYFKDSSKDPDMIAADAASLLSVVSNTLEITKKGNLQEIIINGDNGSLAIKDLGDDIAFGCITPKGYKMGSLVIALKQFIKDIKEF